MQKRYDSDLMIATDATTYGAKNSYARLSAILDIDVRLIFVAEYICDNLLSQISVPDLLLCPFITGNYYNVTLLRHVKYEYDWMNNTMRMLMPRSLFDELVDNPKLPKRVFYSTDADYSAAMERRKSKASKAAVVRYPMYLFPNHITPTQNYRSQLLS